MVIATKQKTNPQNKENSKMILQHASLFSQLLAFFDRNKFKNLVMKHKTERYSKGFKSWDHFVSMLFCQVAQAKSLREISGGLACCMGKLRHLGVVSAPNKSFFLECLKFLGTRNWLSNEIISPPGKGTCCSIIYKHPGCPSVCSKFSWM